MSNAFTTQQIRSILWSEDSTALEIRNHYAFVWNLTRSNQIVF